jgi:hypothetical protein
MKHIIKKSTDSKYYQGTICGENYFTENITEAVKFRSEKSAKDAIKFHSICNVTIVACKVYLS